MKKAKDESKEVDDGPKKQKIVEVFFEPNDGRTKFCRKYMIPGAKVEVVGSTRHLVRVVFPGQKHSDLVSKSFLKKRSRTIIVEEDDEA